MKYFSVILLFLFTLPALSSLDAQDVILKIDTVSVPCNSTNTILVPVRVRNFTNIGSFQFALSWNTSQLQYKYTTAGGASNPFFAAGTNPGFDTTTFLGQGKLSFQWNKVGGATVANNTAVFFVAFTRIGGPVSPVVFAGGAPLSIEITNPVGDELPYTAIAGGVDPIDGQPPVVTCPVSVTREVSGPTLVSTIAPTSVSDNCSLLGVGWSSTGATTANNPSDNDASGAVFNPGLSVVTYTATDISGLTGFCTFTVNLQPSSNSDTLTIIAGGGNASCGQDLNVGITALNFDSLGSLQFSLSWPKNALRFKSFNLAGSALILSTANFDTIGAAANGRLTFYWTADKLIGTTINDGALLFTVSFTPISGNAGNVKVQFTDTPIQREAFSNAKQPPFEVPVLFVDGQIGLSDNVPPTLQCPANQNVQISSGTGTPVNNLAPVVLTDNCGPVTNLAYVRSGATTGQGTGNADGQYAAGVTNVVYTATDASGNSTNCAFSVTVDAASSLVLKVDTVGLPCGDTENKLLVNLRVRQFKSLLGLQFSVMWDTSALKFDTIGNVATGLGLTQTSFQNFTTTPNGLLQFFGAAPLVGWPAIPEDGILFTLRFTVKKSGAPVPIKFTGMTEAANTAFEAVPVTLRNGLFVGITDTKAPVITCGANIVADATTVDCEAVLNLPLPQASDDCSGIDKVVSDQTDNIYPIGNTVVVYTASDKAGNSATCSQQITVQGSAKIRFNACPTNLVTGTLIPDQCRGKATWQAPTAIAACGGGTPVLTSNYMPGDTFPTGVTQVRYTAKDGNLTSTCSFNVRISEDELPKLNCHATNIVAYTLKDTCGAFPTWAVATATDNCDTTLKVGTSTFTPKQFLPTGTTTIVYSAIDKSGNEGTCSFTISVIDTIRPEFKSCPGNITVAMPNNKCDTIVTWAKPTAFDKCNLVSLTASAASGSLFPIGDSLVTITARDVSENVSVCTFRVRVFDKVPPVFKSCPKDTVLTAAGACGAIFNWKLPAATDNCTPENKIAVTATIPTKDTLFGNVNVVVLARDGGGNYDTCAFKITVNATSVATFQNIPESLSFTGCQAIANWTPPNAVGFCTTPVVTSNFRPNDTFPPGVTVVLYSATDNAGLTITATFAITVKETVAPVFAACPTGDVELNAAAGFITNPGSFITKADTVKACNAVRLRFNPLLATDNCGAPEVTQLKGRVSGATFPVGVDTLVFQAKDKAGNSALCRVRVKVNELAAPTPKISKTPGCPNDQIVLSVDSFPGAKYTWTGPQQNYENRPKITIFQLNPGNTGGYSVTVELNGCATPRGLAEIKLVKKPDAVDDLTFLIDPGKTDTFDVLTNDVVFPVEDIKLSLLSQLTNLKYLGNGKFE
jgi:large repetitive protein